VYEDLETCASSHVCDRVVLASSTVCLLAVNSVQSQRFLVEPGVENAGKNIVPIIKVTAVRDK